jgi:uncharacterized membrane protein YqhA
MRGIGSTRYLALIGVLFGWIASVAGFVWGAIKTIKVVLVLASGHFEGMAVALVGIMDAFLIAAGLLIFALGLYELFIGELDLPAWLQIRDLDALKAKLAGIIILAMAVAFLERVERAGDARDILYAGVGVSLVSATMIALTYKHKA